MLRVEQQKEMYKTKNIQVIKETQIKKCRQFDLTEAISNYKGNYKNKNIK